jgi:hypothetical protein
VTQIGFLSSALEHTIPDTFYTDTEDPIPAPEAISAVKALSKASSDGQKLYYITPISQNSALANISHDAATMSEIRAALSIGKNVITHSNSVSVSGWSGAGYIILDPVSGNGAYKISGGFNGGAKKVQSALEGILFTVASFVSGDAEAGSLVVVTKLKGLYSKIKKIIDTITKLFDIAENCPGGLGALYVGFFLVAAAGAAFITTLASLAAGAAGETACGGNPWCGLVAGMVAGYIVADIIADGLLALSDGILELCELVPDS